METAKNGSVMLYIVLLELGNTKEDIAMIDVETNTSRSFRETTFYGETTERGASYIW